MTLEVLDLHHVQISATKDTEMPTAHFYRDILGFEEIPKPSNLLKNGGAWFRNRTTELHLAVEDAASTNHLSKRHVCFLVVNLQEAEDYLRTAGCEIISDQQPIEGWIRFYIRDPADNRVEFAQVTS
jgi:catechol 2,3-dioxygenase-like lactoylglutathione lyase family enzyme